MPEVKMSRTVPYAPLILTVVDDRRGHYMLPRSLRYKKRFVRALQVPFIDAKVSHVAVFEIEGNPLDAVDIC